MKKTRTMMRTEVTKMVKARKTRKERKKKGEVGDAARVRAAAGAL